MIEKHYTMLSGTPLTFLAMLLSITCCFGQFLAQVRYYGTCEFNLFGVYMGTAISFRVCFMETRTMNIHNVDNLAIPYMVGVPHSVI